MTWQQFADAAPDLAAHGARLLAERHGYAFLATTAADGSPRVHPVAPIITPAAVHLALHARSPKRRDLGRDPRFALHSSVHAPHDEEFSVRGTAHEVADDRSRADVRAARIGGAELHDAMVLFELTPEHVTRTVWPDGTPHRSTWRAPPDRWQ